MCLNDQLTEKIIETINSIIYCLLDIYYNSVFMSLSQQYLQYQMEYDLLDPSSDQFISGCIIDILYLILYNTLLI